MSFLWLSNRCSRPCHRRSRSWKLRFRLRHRHLRLRHRCSRSHHRHSKFRQLVEFPFNSRTTKPHPYPVWRRPKDKHRDLSLCQVFLKPRYRQVSSETETTLEKRRKRLRYTLSGCAMRKFPDSSSLQCLILKHTQHAGNLDWIFEVSYYIIGVYLCIHGNVLC